MVLFLNVNNVCDLCCSYCFYTIGHEKRDPSYIHSCQAETFASTIQELGFGCVILSGGDPLCSKLKEHTYSLIEHLKKRGLRVIINTSGAKLGDDDYERLIALEVDRIDVSINSCDEVIHNLERGYYQDAVRLIDTLQKKGYTKLSTTTVITQSNALLAAHTLRWLLDKGVEDVRYQPVFSKEAQDYEMLGNAMDECRNVVNKPHTNKYVQLCHDAYTNPEFRVNDCQMGKSYFVCDARGNLYPCFHIDESLANILTDDREFVKEQMSKSEKTKRGACFGRHCVSLFDNPVFWKE